MRNDVFLLIGPHGVGKTTTGNLIEKSNRIGQLQFKYVDLDGLLAKKSGMEVTEFFGKVGLNEFYEASKEAILDLVRDRDKTTGEILLVDVGSGSCHDLRSQTLLDEFYGILLIGRPEYLYKREKCQKSHTDIERYKLWQFLTKQSMWEKAQVRVDIEWLSDEMVAEAVRNKIQEFQSSLVGWKMKITGYSPEPFFGKEVGTTLGDLKK